MLDLLWSVYMQQYNIHNAKTNLSSLVEKAANGDVFIIAKDGKPMVKVIPCLPQKTSQNRIGFLKGQIEVPADFDQMGQNDMIKLFESTM
jgi:prevent-host-death family protein